MNREYKTMAVVLLCVACLSGCVSTMRGGPQRLLPVELVDKLVVEKAATELASGDFDGDMQKLGRNARISKLVSAADANYYEFRRDLLANSRHSDAASGTLTLLMSIAGSLTGSPGVKQHYLLGTNLVNGVSTQFDKSYLHEKNIASLAATMDADRASQLVVILDGMEQDGYRGQTALLDLYKYLAAGTVESAAISIERQARENAEKNGMIVSDPALRARLRQVRQDEEVLRLQSSP